MEPLLHKAMAPDIVFVHHIFVLHIQQLYAKLVAISQSDQNSAQISIQMSLQRRLDATSGPMAGSQHSQLQTSVASRFTGPSSSGDPVLEDGEAVD